MTHGKTALQAFDERIGPDDPARDALAQRFGELKELLPPGDVETAMLQVRRGELVKSKLAFQAVLQNLSDETQNAERRRDLDLAEENEKRTLREARSRITVDMIGRDLGRAVLFALAGSGGGDE